MDHLVIPQVWCLGHLMLSRIFRDCVFLINSFQFFFDFLLFLVIKTIQHHIK